MNLSVVETGDKRSLSLNIVLSWMILIVPLCVIGYGIGASEIFKQNVWESIGLRRLIRLIAIHATICAAVYFWNPQRLGGVLAICALLFALISVGPGPIAALVIFLLAAQALGDLVIRRPLTSYGDLTETALRLTAGMAMYFCLASMLAYFRVNYPATYWVLTLIPLLFRWRSLRHSTMIWLRPFLSGPQASQRGAWFAGAFLSFILLAHFLVALKPEVSHDGLAMHLYLPGVMSVIHRWPFNTLNVAWAAMPMAGDWGYTIVFLLGGEYSARLLNFAAFGVLTVLLANFAGMLMSRTAALLLTAAFVSSPVVQYVTGSMFVENFLALWLFATFVIIAGRVASVTGAFTSALLLGIALQTKFGSLPFVIVLSILATTALARFCLKTGRSFILHLAVWLLILALIGSPPYLTAWVRTGNPLYPLPLPVGQPSPLEHTAYHEPFRWTSLYDLTFASTDYMEGQNGSLGLHYLLLLPIGAAGVIFLRQKASSIAFSAALIAAVMIYLGSANIRYLYPCLPLFAAGAAGAMAAMESRSRALAIALPSAFVVLTCLNVYLLPTSGWYHHDFFLPDIRAHVARADYINAHYPIAPITSFLKLAAPGAKVAYLGSNQIAGAPGEAYTLMWHHARFATQMKNAPDTAAVSRVLKDYGIEWLVAPVDATALPKPVQEFLTTTAPRFTANGWQARQVVTNTSSITTRQNSL